jgi:hypothetical protein
MTHEYEGCIVDSYIVGSDAEYAVTILVDNAIEAFVWEENYSYKVVVKYIEDLERSRKLI